jgi:hypothetical protein
MCMMTKRMCSCACKYSCICPPKWHILNLTVCTSLYYILLKTSLKVCVASIAHHTVQAIEPTPWVSCRKNHRSGYRSMARLMHYSAWLAFKRPSSLIWFRSIQRRICICRVMDNPLVLPEQLLRRRGALGSDHQE